MARKPRIYLPKPLEWLSILNNGLAILTDIYEEVKKISIQNSRCFAARNSVMTTVTIHDKEDPRQMLDENYGVRGWDLKAGVPTREKLMELNLEGVTDQLERS
jgi:aldehyde:ferredoxin oxidoreductase